MVSKLIGMKQICLMTGKLVDSLKTLFILKNKYFFQKGVVNIVSINTSNQNIVSLVWSILSVGKNCSKNLKLKYFEQPSNISSCMSDKNNLKYAQFCFYPTSRRYEPQDSVLWPVVLLVPTNIPKISARNQQYGNLWQYCLIFS